MATREIKNRGCCHKPFLSFLGLVAELSINAGGCHLKLYENFYGIAMLSKAMIALPQSVMFTEFMQFLIQLLSHSTQGNALT